MTRQTQTRLTFDPAADAQPVWTPDSRRILVVSQRGGFANLFSRAADGTGADERLTTSPIGQWPDSVTPDGAYVLGHENSPATNFDIMRVPLPAPSSARASGALTGQAQPASEPLVHTRFIELNADVSPDGRYFVYQSNESGLNEIYVRRYPNVDGGRWQISTAGGTRPSWAHTGREIFYLDVAGMLTSVAVQVTVPSHPVSSSSSAGWRS